MVNLVTLIISISLEKYNNIIKGFWYCLDEGITLTELLLVFTMMADGIIKLGIIKLQETI